jgi:hypothetical protein
MSFGDVYNADLGSLTGGSFSDFGGAMNANVFGGSGTFTPFDMNVNSLPDFGAGSYMDFPTYDIPY